MLTYMDEARYGKDTWRHAGMFWYDAALGLWVAVSAANPLPVTPSGGGALTDGAPIQIVMLSGAEIQLVPAAPARRAFTVINEGPGIARVKPVTPTWPGNATIASVPVFRSDQWDEERLPQLEWRVFADGDVTIRGMTYL